MLIEFEKIFQECKECGYNKVFDEKNFPYSGSVGTALRHTCRSCYYADQRVRTKLRKQYADSIPSDYACPLCGMTEEKKGKKVKWCVDHDHQTLEFRGLICDYCNRKIGNNTSESIEYFEKVIKYLKKEL